MHHHASRGFFLVEVVVATAIIATVLMLLLGSIQNSVEASHRSLERSQAGYLLEEGAEAVKSIRDNDWASIATLTDGTTYYLSWNGSVWTLSTTVQTIEYFTRSITVAPVGRDTTDDIVASGGTVDVGTKAVTVVVSWKSPSGDKSEQLQLYMSNIRSK